MTKLITLGEIIDRTWDHYKANLPELLGASAWLFLIAIINVISLALYPSASKMALGSSLSGLEAVGVGITWLSSAVLAPLLGLWAFIVLARLVRNQLAGRRGTLNKVLAESFRYFWPAFVISALLLALLLGGIILGLVPAFLFAALFKIFNAGFLIIFSNLLLLLGIVAAIAINLRWAVFYILSPYALFLEEKSWLSALRRSRELARPHFWGVLLRIALPKILFVVAGAFLLYVINFILNIGLSMLAGLNLDLQLRLISIANAVFPMAVAVLINPLLVIADIVLYKDLAKPTA